MLIEIERMCPGCDQQRAAAADAPHFGHMAETWHPAVRLLIIVGSATSLWLLLLGAIV